MQPLDNAKKFVRMSAMSAIVWASLIGIAYAQSSDTGFANPLNNQVSSIPTFIAYALKVLVQVSLPIISLFVVYSGFLFVFARGNTEMIKKAKTNFLYVILGSLLILGAWLIAQLLSGTVQQLTG